MTKQIFLIRLFSFLMEGSTNQYGFIPDIVNNLCFYQLNDYLTHFLTEGLFPSKVQWKSIVHLAVNDVQADHWRDRIYRDSGFSRFKNIHISVSIANFW